MIQDIAPSKLYNQYDKHTLREIDNLLLFDDDGRLFACTEDGRIRFPKGSAVVGGAGRQTLTEFTEAIYLFAVDEERYFLLPGDGRKAVSEERPGWRYESPEESIAEFSFIAIRELRDSPCRMNEIYAAFTGYHLWKWYRDNVFCGRCGQPLLLSETERALQCGNCGNVIYPRINPAVIVGVINGDAILVTRYRRGYSHNALIAGFTEIGETLEECVAREVLEETGIRVKKITYYKSQPWGMAQDLLAGFFCEADGDCGIRMDASELKYAEWVRREEIVLQPNELSLTNEMMRFFQEGKWSAASPAS